MALNSIRSQEVVFQVTQRRHSSQYCNGNTFLAFAGNSHMTRRDVWREQDSEVLLNILRIIIIIIFKSGPRWIWDSRGMQLYIKTSELNLGSGASEGRGQY